MCKERVRSDKLRLLRTLEKVPPTSDGTTASADSIADHSASSSKPVRVFQTEYASGVWGYDRGMGHTLIDELNGDSGSVLMYVHGVLTDSVVEASGAEALAAACGLKAYISYENRSNRWKGLSTLSPLYDNPIDPDSSVGSREACNLLLAIENVYTRTGASPVVVAHSRGALLLTKAAVLWKGLSAAADMEDPEHHGDRWMKTPGFLPVWKKLDDDNRSKLLSSRKAIRNTRIIAITGCPAVPRKDRRWESLQRWAQGRSWNLYSEKDWFLFFVGNPGFGFIPSLGNRNIRFRFEHNSFFANSLAQRVVANLFKHGGLLRDTLDVLIRHNFGRRQLDPDATVV